MPDVAVELQESTPLSNPNPSATQLVAGLRALRQLPSDTILKWRRALDRFAKVSKRGAASVALRTQILDAITASSDEAFHARLAELPVTITDSVGVSSNGAHGVYRNYAVWGITRLSLFSPNRRNAGTPLEPGEVWLEGDDGDSGVEKQHLLTGVVEAASTVDWCEYYSAESGYIEGECATEQELDEAAATIAAMDAELTGAQEEVELAEYCLMNPDDHETCSEQTTFYSEPELAGVEAIWALATPSNLEDSRDDSFEATAFRPLHLNAPCAFAEPTPADALAPLNTKAVASCANEAAQAAIGVAAWVGSKFAAAAVMSAAAPPAAAVGWAVFGALTSGWAAASALASYLECLNEQ